MPQNKRAVYNGPALFSYGFRPFFLCATGFAAIAIPLWVLFYTGELTLDSQFSPVDWHIHEMLFGYAAAVISGFLFTAIPNWTGRMPVRGWPLAALVGLWFAGRIAMAGATGLGGLVVMAIDCSFLAAIVLMVAVEIIAGRNWRNLMVVIPVSLFLLANIVFHIEVLTIGTSDYGRRAGFAVVIFLIMLIGGRVIPSFTRNWLVNNNPKNNPGPMPVPFGRYDALCLLSGAAALVAWIAASENQLGGGLLLLAAALHILRLSRWQGARTWRSPLLLMLHVAYAFIPLGLAVLGLPSVFLAETGQAAGLHLLGIGAIGGMTVAVMMRATLGHTGRRLEIGWGLTSVFVMIVLAAIIRSAFPDISIAGMPGFMIAAGLWTLAFAGFVLRVGPWLALPKAAKRKPSKAPPD
jgi:uncharacterized protein involved in response to NO